MDDRVLYRQILRDGHTIGYLWAVHDEAGYWPRAGSDEDEQVRAYWMRWLAAARERGLTLAEAMASWNPAYAFPHGVPAVGPTNELADLDSLRALAAAYAPPGRYADDTTAAVRHYQVIRDGAYVGRLWASADDEAAGFLPSPDLPGTDPAALAWPRRLAASHASGLTPTQALDALRQAPDDGTTGRLTDPLGLGHLHDLRD